MIIVVTHVDYRLRVQLPSSLRVEFASMVEQSALTPFKLNDGQILPGVGLGTFGMTGESGIASIVSALRQGYRLLDSAVGYRNEAELGEGIRRSGVPASEITVTTKIWARDHGYERARRCIERSRRTLGLDQIGLYLIHWPNPSLGKFVETWKALVDARTDGEVLSIGVSNFTENHLDRIIEGTGIAPAVNQIELHPHFPQEELQLVNRNLGICTQSWSPLGRGHSLLQAPQASEPARRLSVSPAQVVLRWHYQLGALPIPKSSNPQRQLENLAISHFELTEEEVAGLSKLGSEGSRLWNGNPDTTVL